MQDLAQRRRQQHAERVARLAATAVGVDYVLDMIGGLGADDVAELMRALRDPDLAALAADVRRQCEADGVVADGDDAAKVYQFVCTCERGGKNMPRRRRAE